MQVWVWFLSLTRARVLLSRTNSLFSNDSVSSGMVVMRFSGMADFGRLLSSEEARRALWWGLTSPFSSRVLMWLGEGAIVAAWSLFNFMASNCDCESHRGGQKTKKHDNCHFSTFIQTWTKVKHQCHVPIIAEPQQHPDRWLCWAFVCEWG